MNNEEIFRCWAPIGSVWSPWVKPAVFSRMTQLRPGEDAHRPTPVDVAWAGRPTSGTGFVVDLPGAAGVAMGVSLARAGYRPVPLYNGLVAPEGLAGVLNIWPIMFALAGAVPELEHIPLPEGAPPAFLLDADRRGIGLPVRPRMFDNRSMSLPNDFPTAGFLRSRGVRWMTVVLEAGRPVSSDLAHTLRKWNEGGIDLLCKRVGAGVPKNDSPQALEIKNAPWIQLVWFRLVAGLAFKRQLDGGFGGIVPKPSSG